MLLRTRVNVNADNASLIAAAADLKLVQSLIQAIDARAPGLPSTDHIYNNPAATYEPRQVIHPTPRYLPRPVIHPTPRYLPRPVIHPTPRLENPCPPPPECKPNPNPWPFPPPWKLLPPPHPHPPVQVLKISPPRIDILNKGTLVDLFI